jgi:hypothetical protein
MKIRSAAALASLLVSSLLATAHAGDDIELVRYMGKLQYMAHKTALAIDARNQPLASFYVHEIEELIEYLEAVESYDDYAIGSLVKSHLVSPFEALEDGVKAGDWEGASKRFDELVASCNSCHETTDHAYIRIHRSTANPFMQSFDTR